MKNLQGRNALLTGASRGLGVHIAMALAREGVNLALTARSAGDLENVREQVLKHNVNAVTIPADLADTERIEMLRESTEQQLGPVDILINNAGVEISSPYEEFSPDDINLVVKLNLTVPMLLTRSVLPGMLSRGKGHIVNMSSLAGKTGFPYQAPYAATKSGLIKFTHSLRIELADKPVGASVICPGFVAEDGMYARMEKTGGPAPKLLMPTSTEKVAAAVIKSIKQDSAELIINPLPIRPLLVLQEIFTRIPPYIHKAFGTPRYAQKIHDGKAENVKSTQRIRTAKSTKEK